MKENFRRINILITERQYERVQEANLNISGLIRDLLDDRFSHKRIVLSVSPQTRAVYDHIISNFGVSDADLEQHLLKSLDSLLESKTAAITDAREKLKGTAEEEKTASKTKK